MIRASLDELLDAQALDGLLTPTLPVTAALAGQQTVDVAGRTLPVEAAHARFTSLASVTGHPAISIPCGLGEDGLPAGLQAIGRPGGEEVLLGLAAAVEMQDGARAVADARRACQSPT
jgi:Asp-tRNA(Asn)/Glu-tRNA(Gln) amidotransferase A subunit family amidase